MKTSQIVRGVVLAGLLALAAPLPALAGLKIDLVFMADSGLPPKPPLIAGGGNLQEIMQVAAERWERVFKKGGGKWNVTIEYGWATLGGGLYGQERLVKQGGNPNRITRSRVLFNNVPLREQGIEGFFADPTPRDNSEYLRHTSDLANIDGGWLNVGRVFSEPTGDAVDRIDLLTIATHEIGHALGLDLAYRGFQTQLVSGIHVEVKPPRPFAGFEFAVDSTGPHIQSFGHTTLMIIKPDPGKRQLITGADALILAQLSSFDRPNLADPPLDAQQSGEDDDED